MRRNLLTAYGFDRRLLLGIAALLWSSAGTAACDTVNPSNVTIASASPAAIKASAVPLSSAKTSGGFGCTSSAIISLLSTSVLKATVATGATFTLTSGSNTVTYKLYADAAGANELKANIATSYVNGSSTLLTLAGGAIDVPIYFKLASASLPPAGTYTGSVSIKWDWYFCSLLGIGTLCVGTVDQGSKSTTVSVTLNVAPKPPTIVVNVGTATWNAVEGTSNPKAIPDSKRRVSVTVTNPDIVALDAGVVQIELPTPARMVIALDGDGTGGSVVQTSEGSPASSLTLSYIGPANTGDNVDFSSDGGSNWAYYPTAGNATSQAAVNRIRFRPQGSMAPGSSYTISIPFSVN
jgi:spore coat protein U-like protein